jgi:trehalose-6-phosphatase
VTSPKPGEGGLPSALEHREEIFRRAQGKRLAVFLDYEGTLTPIVAPPEGLVTKWGIKKTHY